MSSKKNSSYAVVQDEEAQIVIELTDHTPIENVPEPQAPPLHDTIANPTQKKVPADVSHCLNSVCMYVMDSYCFT